MTGFALRSRRLRLKDRARAAGTAALTALFVIGAGLVVGTPAHAAAASSPAPASNTATAPKTPAASSAPGFGGPAWSALKPAQQSALAPLQRDWPLLEAERKAKWLEVAARFPSMSADEQLRIQARMTEWARMSPAERGRARLQFQEARQLGSESRLEKWDAYQALPADERRALAERSTPAASVAKARTDARTQAAAASAASQSNEKRNLVSTSPARPPAGTPVSPTSVQVAPGATTTLMSKPAEPPAHHQPGLPKIAATNGFVDPATLLPQRGPQGAAVRSEPQASAAPAAAPRR